MQDIIFLRNLIQKQRELSGDQDHFLPQLSSVTYFTNIVSMDKWGELVNSILSLHIFSIKSVFAFGKTSISRKTVFPY